MTHGLFLSLAGVEGYDMYGLNALSDKRRQQAFKVVQVYDKLLRIQLDAPSKGMRPSVRKLLAQGNLKIEGGQAILFNRRSLSIDLGSPSRAFLNKKAGRVP